MPNYYFWLFVDELLNAMGPVLLGSIALLVVMLSYDRDRRFRRREDRDDAV